MVLALISPLVLALSKFWAIEPWLWGYFYSHFGISIFKRVSNGNEDRDATALFSLHVFFRT